MATKVTQIEAARAAADRADWVAARDALCAAWAERPSVRIAKIVAAIDARLPREALAQTTVREREIAWQQLALTHNPKVLSMLLHAPWPVHANITTSRVNQLATWPPSPRISNAFVSLLASGTFTGASRNTLLRRIVTIMFRARDPAITAYLVAAETDRTLGNALTAKLAWKNRPAEPIVDEPDEAHLRSLEAHFAPRARDTREQLLAAIYAAPHDDGPREVYADVLVEELDPHGELIVLQLRRARGERGNRTRERALIREGGRAWFGDLDRDGASAIELQRGFPGRVQIDRRFAFTAPAWATVETIVFPSGPGLPFSGSPLLRGLRRLFGVQSTSLALIMLPDPELEILSVIGTAIEGPTALAPRALALRSGRGEAYGAERERLVAKLATVPLGRRCTRLILDGTYEQLPNVFALAAIAPQLEEVEVWLGVSTDVGPECWQISWNRAGTLRCVWRGREALATIIRLADVLKALPMAHASKITALEVAIEIPLAEVMRAATRDKIRASVQSWPALTRSDIL